ncbi:hypothetical protein MUK42_15618 [Musa troglodytarum]|uniref:Uncharacterized protein n=1 Tax=Musa troglodytarum TaxID=320322 RepID=A0A9E7HFI7_9LILI|nr:hypothetical protein MUK42_15618 [Musa troglodytarum]
MKKPIKAYQRVSTRAPAPSGENVTNGRRDTRKELRSTFQNAVQQNDRCIRLDIQKQLRVPRADLRRRATRFLSAISALEPRWHMAGWIPVCHISESVYKISVDWIALKSPEALCEFVLWCLDSILIDLASQQSTVAIFVVLAMVLRRRPDTLISLLPKLKDNSQYHGQEKLPVIVWLFAQASQGDPVVGMYLWAHYLFPVVCGKSSGNPQSRDLVLQLVERILSRPKARAILLNGAVRKGEHLVPPNALDLLMRITVTAPASRVKATERFEVVYPTLRELALAGSPGTKTTRQAAQQLLPAAVQAIQEKNPELTKEATDIFIWCLSQNAECYRQWENLHLENVHASIAVLQNLSSEWGKYSAKVSPNALRETLENLRAKRTFFPAPPPHARGCGCRRWGGLCVRGRRLPCRQCGATAFARGRHGRRLCSRAAAAWARPVLAAVAYARLLLGCDCACVRLSPVQPSPLARLGCTRLSLGCGCARARGRCMDAACARVMRDCSNTAPPAI